jgi:hypothetical protein
MSLLWSKLDYISDRIQLILSDNCVEVYETHMDKFNKDGWVNKVYKNKYIRRAHIDIVDARELKGMWMMHCCIFPNVNNSSPIFGYDVIAGKDKITGFFHDFSPVGETNPMLRYFEEITSKLEWKKTREMPEWAKHIFSDNIIAAGNIKVDDITDLNNFDVVLINLEYFLKNVGTYQTDYDYKDKHNKYAFYQKQNPHTPKVMKSLGLPEKDVDMFISECLFPEIQ